MVVEDVEIVNLTQKHIEDGLWVVLFSKEGSCSFAVNIFDDSVTGVKVAFEPKMLGEVLNALSVVYGHQLGQKNVLI